VESRLVSGKGGAELRSSSRRWSAGTGRSCSEADTHVELAQMILDESGYTAMWKADKSPDAAGRLENLKELVKALEEFDSLQGFLSMWRW
jgi:DNA helicase-2/ATP-dependent DNA helicase PcrA